MSLLLTVHFTDCTFSPLFRFLTLPWSAQIAQLAEHVLGKDEVAGSNPVLGSIVRKRVGSGFYDVKLEVIFIHTQTFVSHG